jgi:hypothetical protein
MQETAANHLHPVTLFGGALACECCVHAETEERRGGHVLSISAAITMATRD